MLEPSYLSVTWDLCLAISGFTLVHQFFFFGRGHVNQRSSSLQKLEEKNPSELISMFTMLSPIAGSKHFFFHDRKKDWIKAMCGSVLKCCVFLSIQICKNKCCVKILQKSCFKNLAWIKVCESYKQNVLEVRWSMMISDNVIVQKKYIFLNHMWCIQVNITVALIWKCI